MRWSFFISLTLAGSWARGNDVPKMYRCSLVSGFSGVTWKHANLLYSCFVYEFFFSSLFETTQEWWRDLLPLTLNTASTRI